VFFIEKFPIWKMRILRELLGIGNDFREEFKNANQAQKCLKKSLFLE